MTGRGVDQILPHPGAPELREQFVRDARTYVELAEAANGPVPRPVDFSWPWGDALQIFEELAPHVRLINLETSVTRSADYLTGKPIHYRMHPENVACLTAARLDACALANNHVLDFGAGGLAETLDTLGRAGLRAVGAGRDEEEAWRAGRLEVGRGRRVLVWSVATASSGVPANWAATGERAGVAFAEDLSDAGAAAIVDRVRRVRRPGDLAVVSIHWGSNWGYEIPPEQTRFAHRLIDGGVDVVHGHSSHHPRPIEIYRNRLVLYGCGDLVDDYEGIGGHEQYRGELRLLYFARLDAGNGELLGLRMVPVRMRQLRLRHAGRPDAQWLCDTLDGVSRRFGTRLYVEPDGSLALPLG